MMEKNVADYGFDAPYVNISLFLGALIIGTAAFFFPVGLVGGLTSFIILALWLTALTLLTLGSSMIFYCLVTKRHIRDFILNQVPWRGDETVLDIGTGRGLLMIGAAKRLISGRSIGIDIWNSKDLSGNTQQNALKNITVEQVAQRTELYDGDARDLQLPNQSVDVVMSLFCIHNIEDKRERAQALKEIVRVLKPGGKVIIGEWIPTHPYAKVLAESGLIVESSRNYIAKACSLMWIVMARKPV